MPARRILAVLLVAALAALIWLWPAGEDPAVELPDDVRACSENLRALYADLVLHRAATGGPPGASGRAFLSAPLDQGTVPDTPARRARLLCPRTGSPYAGRDVAAHPLARFPSGGAELEALAACDGGAAHADGVNVLYSDGSVQMLLFAQEIERGRLPAGARALPLGPDSPIPELRALSGR